MKIATPKKMMRKADKAIGQGRAPDPKKKGLMRVSKKAGYKIPSTPKKSGIGWGGEPVRKMPKKY